MNEQSENKIPSQQAPETTTEHAVARRFDSVVEELSRFVPELQNSPEVLVAGKELIETFDIQESLFDNESHQMVFAAVATRWAENKSKGEQEAEKEFIADTLTLLAADHSPKLGEAKKQAETSANFGDETKSRVYERYTDTALSEAIKNKIDGGFLDSLKEKLRITSENEDAYDLRVLSLADRMTVSGLDAPKPDYSLPFNHPDLESAIQLQDDVRDWKQGLENRGIAFAKELGSEGLIAPAWVTKIDGKRTLCISTALAEKILDPSVVDNTDFYSKFADSLERDLAVLQHEYTHTQGGLNIDGGTEIGINLEELRAEQFSGNKQGYQEVKGFFQNYTTITGHTIARDLEDLPKGGTIREIYGAIANRVGLSRMLEVVLAAPNNYIADQPNVFQKHAHEHIGGFDGILERLYESEVAAGNEAAIVRRIDAAAGVVVDVSNNSSDFIDFFEGYRKSMGLTFMTNKIVARAREKQLSDEARK